MRDNGATWRWPQEFQGPAGLCFHEFSPSWLSDRADFEKQRGGERFAHCSQQFSAENLFSSQTSSLKETRLCLEIAAEAKKGVFFLCHICIDHTDIFKPEQLIASSGLPHVHHPALSLRLGCHGQPGADSQPLTILLCYLVLQMAAEKWGSRKMQINPLEMYWIWHFSLSFQCSWHLYSTLYNDTKKPFGLEVGGFLLSWSVLPSEDSVGNKAVGRVGRMTSHLGRAHGWTLLLPHLGPLSGPRQDPGKHPGVLKTPVIIPGITGAHFPVHRS